MQQQANPIPTESPYRKLLRIKEVEKRTSFHRQTIWRKVKAGTFPKPRKLGTLNVWPEDEIQAWLDGVIQPALAIQRQRGRD